MVFCLAITVASAWLVGVGVSIDSSAFPPVSNGPINWTIITMYHNRYLLENISVILYQQYSSRAGVRYSMDSIMSRIDIDIARSSLDVEGSWFNFRKKIAEMLKTAQNEIKFLKVLFTGGSVCSGAGCFPVERELMGIDNERFDSIVAWCSWTRRFVLYFQRVLDALTNNTAVISYRVCCSGGASTVAGLDVLKGKDYASNHCGNVIDYRWNPAEDISNTSGWEPDIVFWDYGVNDGSGEFFMSYPRQLAYETFISRVIHLPSKPQLVSLDFLHGYLEAFNGRARKERRSLNTKYCIPMVNYLSMFNRKDVHGNLSIKLVENTPWYAATLRNNHPSWPTHALWAKLVTLVLIDHLPISGIAKAGLLGSESAIFDVSKNETSRRNSELNCSALVVADGFCSLGYTTRYDFTGGASENITHLIDAQIGDGVLPVAVKGSWKLRSDRSSDIDRSGWTFIRQKLNSAESSNRSQSSSDCTYSERHLSAFKSFNCSCHDANFIVFRCNAPVRGAAKIGYLASYGPQWGSVFVTVTHSANKSTGIGKDYVDLRRPAGHVNVKRGASNFESTPPDSDSLADGIVSEQSFVISSRWQLRYSVLQEHRVLGPSIALDKQHKLSYIDIAISMCTGVKFKLESISCC